MSTLVECVPNFSEGCDKWRVDAIVEAMKMPGVYLLDRESDSDQKTLARVVWTIKKLSRSPKFFNTGDTGYHGADHRACLS